MKTKLLLALLISLPLVLNGCGGAGEEPSAEEIPVEQAGKTLYEVSDFSILYPQDWEILKKDSYTSNVPQEVVIAFRNNIKSEVFTANVVISKSPLTGEISSKDFAKSSIAKAKNSLVSFSEIDSEEYKNGQIADFQGRKSASEPTIYFKVLYLADGSDGYTVTGAYLPTEDESVVKAVDEMLKSFLLK